MKTIFLYMLYLPVTTKYEEQILNTKFTDTVKKKISSINSPLTEKSTLAL